MPIFDPKTKAISGFQKQIDEKKQTINKYYDQIGRLYYGQYKDMSVDVTKDINTRCEAVSDLQNEITELEHKILFEKGLKLCPNCGKENLLAYAFCFGCGTKFETEEDKKEEAKKEEAKSETATVEEAKEEETPVDKAAVAEESAKIAEEAMKRTEEAMAAARKAGEE